MISYEDALKIAKENGENGSDPFGFAETKDLWVFTNHLSGVACPDYVYTVGKSDGSFGCLSFFDWADLVDAGEVTRFS